jgi:hypothetical protein
MPHVHRSGRLGSRSTNRSESAFETVYVGIQTHLESDTDIMWRIIAFALATEASLFVALSEIPAKAILRLGIGLGAQMIGLLGPLSIRYVESARLLDRILLDKYEQKLLRNNSRYLQEHSEKLVSRMQDFLDNKDLTPGDRARIAERRLGDGRTAEILDKALDLFGQPTIVWTMAIAIAGSVGFDWGLAAEVHVVWILTIVDLIANGLLIILWLISNNALRRVDNRIRRGVTKAIERLHRKKAVPPTPPANRDSPAPTQQLESLTALATGNEPVSPAGLSGRDASS